MDEELFSSLPLGRQIVALVLLNLIMIPVSWAAYMLFHGWIPRPWSVSLGGAIFVWAIGYLFVTRRRRTNPDLERFPPALIGDQRDGSTSGRDQYLIDPTLRR